jgi:hypothetical protein
MDAPCFVALVRSWKRGSRRASLRLLAGGSLSGVLTRLGTAETSAKRNGKKRRKRSSGTGIHRPARARPAATTAAEPCAEHAPLATPARTGHAPVRRSDHRVARPAVPPHPAGSPTPLGATAHSAASAGIELRTIPSAARGAIRIVDSGHIATRIRAS